jgi:hypothetical protein
MSANHDRFGPLTKNPLDDRGAAVGLDHHQPARSPGPLGAGLRASLDSYSSWKNGSSLPSWCRFIVLYGYQRKIVFTRAFGLGALSMTMPFVTNDYLAVVLMGLALFGNQWVAATYIGTVGDVVPQHLAGRVNGIAGLGDNGAALPAVLYTGVVVDKYGWTRCSSGRACCHFLQWRAYFS